MERDHPHGQPTPLRLRELKDSVLKIEVRLRGRAPHELPRREDAERGQPAEEDEQPDDHTRLIRFAVGDEVADGGEDENEAQEGAADAQDAAAVAEGAGRRTRGLL